MSSEEEITFDDKIKFLKKELDRYQKALKTFLKVTVRKKQDSPVARLNILREQ
jgi:hypothetical protein